MEKITADSPESKSADVIAGNIEQLRRLFPDAWVEGKIDFNVFRQLLGGVVDEREEKYVLNWHGKRKARQLALTPSTGTLRPYPTESESWISTQNLLIEGDNLEVLKLLGKSYAGSFKLVYIDPPYNTGGDFIYPDDFKDNIRNFLEITGQAEGGRKRVANTEASGRFHTDWLNMMYPRLKLAQKLLKNEGVILISIDEHEFANLNLVMNEIFGDENLVGTIVWKGATDNNPTQIATEHEYLVCYAKDKNAVEAVWKNSSDDAKQTLLAEYRRIIKNPLLSEDDIRDDIKTFIRTNKEALSAITHYDRVDKKGVYTGSRKVHNPKPGGYVYDVVHPVTKKVCVPPVNGYRYPKDTMGQLIADGRILFGDDENQIIQVKEYLEDYEGKLSSVIHLDSRAGANELNDLFEVQKLFSNPKPVLLLKDIFEFLLKPDDMVLDFFAGSGTTAHSVWKLNTQDKGKRRCVLVQLPEPLDPDNKDQKVAAGFCDKLGKPRNIAELTKERLRRAGKRLKQENPSFGGDLGFRVYKLDSSNIREWDPKREEMAATLDEHAEHLKAGRTEEDILTELLLKLGLDLCVPIESRRISEVTVYSIGAGTLFACLPEKITRAQVKPLGQGILAWRQELKVAVKSEFVFRDSAFVDDVAKTNLSAYLEQNLPETQRGRIRSL